MSSQDITLSSAHLTPEELRSRIAVNDGLRPGEGLDGGLPYYDAAFMPGADWRAPTDAEFTALTQVARPEPRFFANVALLRAPADVAARIGDLATTQAQRLQESSLRTSPPDLRLAIHEAVADLPGVRPVGPMLSVARAISAPGLRTLTPDRDGHRVGLHVDSWDNAMSLRTRREASNRVAINMGAQPRYFLFIPLQVHSLLGILGLTKIIPPYTDIAREYLRNTPEAKVYRIEIRPLEYYVAPTENMIHDGSTLGMTTDDHSLSVRGYIHIEGCGDAVQLGAAA